MAIIEIHDKRSAPINSLSILLGFDLRDLMEILSPQSQQAEWVVCPVVLSETKEELFEATDKGGSQLEILAEMKSRISGTELTQFAENTRQVIWGQFVGFLGQKRDPWITLNAIDSSFWEIITEDVPALEKIKRTFRDVRASDKRYG